MCTPRNCLIQSQVLFRWGPFDGLQINSLKFGCFCCNEALMDTCSQSAGETSHPEKSLATVPCENESHRTSRWPSGSYFLSDLSPQVLGPSLHSSCLLHRTKLSAIIKPPTLDHLCLFVTTVKTRAIRHVVYGWHLWRWQERRHFLLKTPPLLLQPFCQKWFSLYVIKGRNRSNSQSKGDYFIWFPGALSFLSILFFIMDDCIPWIWWMGMQQHSNFILKLP